ncbi:MAG TPA: tetratricopeptide repeat protein [Pirellulales bacterium]|nr:tetratricopeptide repeat protein [Pirellulales bacterium]
MRTQTGVTFTAGLLLLLSALLPGRPAAAAESEGQPDLDRAIELKLSAETLAEWGAVIDLCQSALDKGLDKDNEEFCKQLLSSTLLQRAEAIGGRLLQMSRDELELQGTVAWRMAVKDVERAVEIDPKQAASQLWLGKLQAMQGGDHTTARKALGEAIRLAGDDDATKAEALRWRAQVSETLDDRLKDLSDAIELIPQNGEILRLRGATNLAAGKEDAALADFDAALKIDDDDADAHEGRAMTLEAMKRYDEAHESYGRAAELAPGNAIPLLQRARVSALAGKHEQTIEDVTRALEVAPDNLFGLLLKAQTLALLDKADEAIPEANRALEAYPDSDDALRIWAMVIEKAGKTQSSIKELRQQVEANPDDAIAWLQLGLLYSAQHKSGKAIDAYSAAIKINPREFAYQVRADTYLNHGMQKEAIDDYEQALKIAPANSGVLNNLAWVLATSPEAELRDGNRALELAMKACEVTNYKQAHILSTLAAAYAEKGDFATARKWSAQSVEMGEDALKDQLRKELASYEKEEPWREKQGAEEEPKDDQ